MFTGEALLSQLQNQEQLSLLSRRAPTCIAGLRVTSLIDARPLKARTRHLPIPMLRPRTTKSRIGPVIHEFMDQFGQYQAPAAPEKIDGPRTSGGKV